MYILNNTKLLEIYKKNNFPYFIGTILVCLYGHLKIKPTNFIM